MRVVVAPDEFTGSRSAPQVATHLAAGLVHAAPGTEVVQVPVADGGAGTLDAAVTAGYRRVPVCAQGPTGGPVETAYAERNGTAVVEMADGSGLRRLPGGWPAARTASSHGTGEVIRAVAGRGLPPHRAGQRGSASTDGGAGLVQALGPAPARPVAWGSRRWPRSARRCARASTSSSTSAPPCPVRVW